LLSRKQDGKDVRGTTMRWTTAHIMPFDLFKTYLSDDLAALAKQRKNRLVESSHAGRNTRIPKRRRRQRARQP